MSVDFRARVLKTFRSRRPAPSSQVSGGRGSGLHVVLSRRARMGVTLLELLVVVALLGVVAAFALPTLIPLAPHGATLPDAIRTARSAAIARAQLLTLAVSADGAWEVRPWPAYDAPPIASGSLRSPPTAAVRLQLTPLGACIAATPLPDELRGWDAAGCTAPAIATARGGAR